MRLDDAVIYRRTDRGVREVYEKSHQFTQSERLILILLDGRLNVAGVRARLPSVSDERLARALGKLSSAGLIEPARSAPAAPAGPLQPDAIAQYLAQDDVDPVTVIGSGDELQPLALARGPGSAAVNERKEPAWSATESGDVDAPERPYNPPDMGSVRSHEPKFPETGWDPARATDFAITTVNVPDRLDVQEVRARDDEMRRRRLLPDRYYVGLWAKRLLWLAVLGGLVYWLYESLSPMRTELSAERMAERLSRAAGQPVRVADTEIGWIPTPRYVLKSVALPGGVAVEQVQLHVNWRDAFEALRGGQVVWGEALIPRLAISSEQALGLAAFVTGLSGQLPATISTLRIGELTIREGVILNDRYEAVVRRDASGRFGSVDLRALGNNGTARMLVTAAVGESGNPGLAFRLDATQWRPPLGPAIAWPEFNAEGWAERNLILIHSFLATGFYGAVQGTAAAAADVEWVATAHLRGTNLDLEALLQSLRAGAVRDGGGDGGPRMPMQGTATLDLIGIGRGDTLAEALSGGEVFGPVQVRWAVLNGINLGYAATQGYSGGGITRFTELQAEVAAGGGAGLTVKNVLGRAGAMTTRGQFTVAPDLALDGALRVELGATRIQAPLNLRVRGTVLEPRFGR